MKIKDLINSGESETLEFKEKFDDITVESAVAFANAKGGMILLGVNGACQKEEKLLTQLLNCSPGQKVKRWSSSVTCPLLEIYLKHWWLFPIPQGRLEHSFNDPAGSRGQCCCPR